MTPAELQAAIAAKSLLMRVSLEAAPGMGFDAYAGIATAREDDGWLYVACEPILNDGGEPWKPSRLRASLWTDGRRRISEWVTIRDEVDVPPGRSLLVAIGLRLQAANGTANVGEGPSENAIPTARNESVR